jgi:glutathione synthase/RimK-type ligase-like ATP-grasp enzyme
MILLVSNSRDFATDYVVAQLRERAVPYYRLDLDLLEQDEVALDPVRGELSVNRGGNRVLFNATDIKSILYRAPTHLRESSSGRWSPEALLARHQWAAFARSLMVFDNAIWVNHPRNTYLAENKPYQLMLAARLGLAVPETVIGNVAPCHSHPAYQGSDEIAIKALDSFLLRISDEHDAFFYTQPIRRSDLDSDSLAQMPIIMQRLLTEKIDLRVTVVDGQCFSVSVQLDGHGIAGDWRLAKNQATFAEYELPAEVASKCIELVKELGLVFGAIDLARVADRYYFLEINPTGEWAWLVDKLGLPLDKAIADALLP